MSSREPGAMLRNLAVVLPVVVSFVAIALVGPPALRWFGDRLQHDQVAAVAPPIDVSTAAPPTSISPSTSAAPAVAPTSPPPSAPATPQAAHPVAVTRIQTVPAVRDFVVLLDGRATVTDGSGAIAIGPEDGDAAVEVVGITADPPIQQVSFDGWADGSVAPNRDLATVGGPTAQLALTVSHRVTVDTAAAEVTFASDAGPLTVQSSSEQWIVSSRAVAGPDGLQAATITYTAPSGQTFTASPEAIWTVTERTPSADSDFATTLALNGRTAPSLVLLRSVDQLKPNDHAAILIANLPGVEADLAEGAAVSIGTSHVRVRRLPI